MDLPAEPVLFSWAFEPVPTIGLLLAGGLYVRGWRKLHLQVPWRFPAERLASFLAGLLAVYVALASPLDAFAGWLLIVHMVQHLMLTMVAPPLLLLGWPMLPLLSGLPRGFAREGLGPFLTSPSLHRIGRFLVHPFFAGPLFLASNLAWHTPALYELALGSPAWHQAEHLCFLGTSLLFWWPVVQPWPSRPALPRWAMIPYLLAADLQNTALAAFLTFYGGVLYPTYAAAPRISGLSAVEDQAGAGAVMWVPGSMVFLLPVAVIAVGYLSPKRSRREEPHRPPRLAPSPRQAFDLLKVPWLGPLIQGRFFRPALQSLMFAAAILVAADGFFGPQASPVNLAGVIPWLHWTGLSAIALLVFGNFFCMACPFTLARDLGRKIFPSTRVWPRALRSKWLAVAVLAVFFWAYEFLNLWDSPWWTAWIIVFYFSGAMLVDGIFKGASYCKYVCPIGQFNFLASLSSPMEVRVREPGICGACKTHDCLRGNDLRRGCELELFLPRKSGNMDCTFCLDCVKACPQDNVGILAVPPGRDLALDLRRSSVGRFAQRPDLALLALAFVFSAFANVAAMTPPAREFLLGAEQSAGPVAARVAGLGAFVIFVLLLPSVLAWGCGALSARFCREPAASIACGFSAALLPLGFAMWVAHVCYHLFTGALTPLPIFQRVALDLGLSSAAPEWNVPVPAFDGLPGLQILALDAGLLLALWVLWKKSHALGGRAMPVFLPWALMAAALYCAGLWLIFQPIEMPISVIPR